MFRFYLFVLMYFNLLLGAFGQQTCIDQVFSAFYMNDTMQIQNIIDSLEHEKGEAPKSPLLISKIIYANLIKQEAEVEVWLNELEGTTPRKSPFYGDYILQKLIFDYNKNDDLPADSLTIILMRDSQYYSDRVIAEIYNNTAIYLQRNKDLEFSRSYFLRAYYSEYAEKNETYKARYANGLGTTYKDKKDTERRLELLHFAVAKAFPRTKVSALANLAVYYGQNGKADTALVLINKAIELDEILLSEDKDLLGTRANIYLMKKEFNKAIADYEKEYRLLKSDASKAINKLNIALAYNGLKDKPNAIENMKEANLYARKTKNYRLREFILSRLSSLYKTEETLEEVLTFAEERIDLKDSIAQVARLDLAEEMEAKYLVKEVKMKNKLAEAKVKKISNESRRQKQYLLGGSLLLLVLSFASFLFFRQREKQKQLNQTLTAQRDQIKILNRELNHRVKNNLAFMTSLLEMQGRRTDNDEAKQVLRESESRLKALSIVHNNLFQNESNTEINLKIYLQEIVNHLQNIFEIPSKSLSVETQFTDIDFDAEDAMRVGLIVNELVTNSVKHAFADVDHPKIILETLQNPDGKIVLRYKDNGPGFVQKELKGADLKTSSIGVKLIELLERQLATKLDLQLT